MAKKSNNKLHLNKMFETLLRLEQTLREAGFPLDKLQKQASENGDKALIKEAASAEEALATAQLAIAEFKQRLAKIQD